MEVVDESRYYALSEAVRLHLGNEGNWRFCPQPYPHVSLDQARGEILATAERFHAWLAGPVTLRLARGPILDQDSGQPISPPNSQGAIMSQLHDSEKFSLSVSTTDAKGFATADAISWSEDSGGAVIALTVSDDSQSVEVVAVAPGSAVITVSDAAAGLSATEAVDVIPGATAKIDLVEGPVVPQ